MRLRLPIGLAFAVLVAFRPSAAHAQATYGQGTQGGYGSGTYGSQGQGTYGSGAASGTYGNQGYGTGGSGASGTPGSSGLQAGGLAPPSSDDSGSQETEQHLEEAEQKDSGRGLEIFYVNAEAGLTHLGLQTFHANHLLDANVVSTTQTGPTFGAGLGVRLLFLTVGARFRLSNFSDYQVWTLGAELGLRIPLGMLEPYFTLGGGYAKLGSFSASNIGGSTSGSDVKVSGYDIRASFGLDVYVTPVLSIGGNLSGDVLGLSRGRVTTSVSSPNDVYAQDGSSVGLGGTLTAVVGLHF